MEYSGKEKKGGKMRAKTFLFALLIGLFFLPARAQEFGYPSEGEGWYYIKVFSADTSETRNKTWKVEGVKIDDSRIRDFLVFQNGEEIYDRVIDGNLPFELKTRYNWSGDNDYRFRIELSDPKAENPLELELSVTSPPMRGYWDQAWKNYLALSIAEENGYSRTRYPVHATVSVLSRYLHTPDEIRVVKVENKGIEVSYTEIPCQVYDVASWQDQTLLLAEEIDEATGMPVTRYHPTTTFSLCFLADFRPKEKASYLVFYNNPSAPSPAYDTDLRIRGGGLGKIIENSYFRVDLDRKSGMIKEIIEKKTGLKLEHKLETNGAIHWNPGTYSPPHAWSHASDWDNPDFREIEGPIFYSLRRAAPLPHLRDVLVSIDYTFYKDSPVILMESTMQIENDLFVKALRNGEVVFNKEIFDKAAYETMGGRVLMVDFAHTRLHPEHVITLRPDTPWIAFFNQEKNIAFASLFLDVSTSNIYGGGASCQQPYIYIQHGPWYYLARAFVYSFGSNNQSRMLPVKKGSIYHERTAWIPFSFRKNKDLTSFIRKKYRMFKYPLGITEIMETYPESPRGWLVPILTEPFEEGVEGALKGKKKK
jgi:hypothetical protein